MLRTIPNTEKPNTIPEWKSDEVLLGLVSYVLLKNNLRISSMTVGIEQYLKNRKNQKIISRHSDAIDDGIWSFMINAKITGDNDEIRWLELLLKN